MARFKRTLCLAVIGILAGPCDLWGMGFSCPRWTPLAEDVLSADCVFLGRLSNAQRRPDSAGGEGTTDCDVLSFAKEHAFLRGKTRFSDEAPKFDRPAFLAAVEKALHQPDWADLVINDLRHAQQWQYTQLILSLYDHPESPRILKRAILRYALCCPDPAAKSSFKSWLSGPRSS